VYRFVYGFDKQQMTSLPPVPLVFFHVLAERGGRPAGLLLDLGQNADADGTGACLLPLVDSDAFANLAASLACLYRPLADPALAAALQEAGWRALADGALCRVDGRLTDALLAPGAAWVDGDWCMAPPPKLAGAQAALRVHALRLVQLVAVDADTHAIEALLRCEPTLSYNLLLLVNSLGVGSGRRITGFSQALLILGRQQLRRWLNLMLFAARPGDVRSAMLRARCAPARSNCSPNRSGWTGTPRNRVS